MWIQTMREGKSPLYWYTVDLTITPPCFAKSLQVHYLKNLSQNQFIIDQVPFEKVYCPFNFENSFVAKVKEVKICKSLILWKHKNKMVLLFLLDIFLPSKIRDQYQDRSCWSTQDLFIYTSVMIAFCVIRRCHTHIQGFRR